MEVITVLLIAVGLSFDTFAVSVSCGLHQPRIHFLRACTVAFPMALFQGGMPVIGWFMGKSFSQFLSGVDHWIAFVFLVLIGLKMILDSRKKDGSFSQRDRLGWRFVLGISLATSIDALVVGFSLGLIDINILLSSLIIGSVTFLVAMLGILLGKKAVGMWGNKMSAVGGVILILIGLKILAEHLIIPV